MVDKEPMLGIVQKYLNALADGDGQVAASLFTENGVIDDGLGRHWEGRDQIRGFISRPRKLAVEAPSHVIYGPQRLVAFGHLTLPLDHTTFDLLRPQDGKGRLKFRWVFHFSGSLISHLSNSFLRLIPEAAEPIDSANSQQAHI